MMQLGAEIVTFRSSTEFFPRKKGAFDSRMKQSQAKFIDDAGRGGSK
jgi:hypothetical protein